MAANPTQLDPDQQSGTQVVQGASGPVRSPAVVPVESTAPQAQDAAARDGFRQRRLQTASLIVLACAAGLGMLVYAKLPLISTLTSVLLAFVLAPVVDLLLRFRLPRTLASLIAVLLLVSALYGVVYVSYSKGVEFVQEMPRYSSEVRRIVTRFRHQAEKLQQTTQTVMSETGDDKRTVRVRQESSWTDTLKENFGSVSEIVLMVSFIPFLVYFMLSWQDHARTATVMLFRTQNRNTAYVTLGLISSMIRSFIVGNVLVGLFMAAVSVAVFGLLQVPYFYFIGVISGFLSLVPYLGVVLALVPPLIAALGRVTSTGMIAIVLTVFGLHLFALNVLYPKFLGSRLQLNPLAVTLALLFWGFLWGGMGLILAVPITAAIKIIFDHVESLRPYGAWLGE